jgi:hypothetical protein
MKLFTGWILSAGLVLTAATAHAQAVAPDGTGGSYKTVSDIDGPYAAMPPDAPMRGYGYGPTLLPPREVYTVLRDNGFSPLGAPQPRGLFYVIAVIDRAGEDGRLVIDARNGRIVRFMPAYRFGNNPGPAVPAAYGPPGALPPVSNLRSGVPRPPAPVPQVASRTPSVPLPKASPQRPDDAKPLAAKPAPEPVQQSAAVQTKPATDAPPAPQAAAPPAVEAKPAPPQIQPTQEMPKVQGLE